MYIDDTDDGLPDDATAEPAPAGWTDDPREMKRRAKQLADAGDLAGAASILETLYAQGLRYPVALNIAFCYSKLGDLATAAQWMSEALDDPALPQSAPYPYEEASGRAGFLEAHYQWSRGQAYP